MHLSNVPSWVYETIVYQIMPDRFANGNKDNDPPGTYEWGERPIRSSFFGGDLQGIIDHLDYLQDLGVETLYLTPIFAAPTTHKYDASDYFTIDPAFGDLEVFTRLVRKLHDRNMRLMLDGVFNHCGDQHPAFLDAVEKGPASRTWNWFSFYGYPVKKRPPNYKHGGIYYLPKWNIKNPEVRKYLQDVVVYWTRQGIDGWRLDVPWYIDEHEFWQELRVLVRDINPEAYIIGEHWGDASPYLTGDQFDGATDYQLRDIAMEFVSGDAGPDGAERAARRLRELYSLYPFHHRLAMWNLVGSHDTKRIMTVFRGNVQKVMLMYVLAFTFPGVPQLYYGDEIGLRGGNDPDCRRCFMWDESKWNHELREFIRRLIVLRRSYPALQTGYWELLHAEGGLLVFQRRKGMDVVIVAIDNGDGEGRFILPCLSGDGQTVDRWYDVLQFSRGSREERQIYDAGSELKNSGQTPCAWIFTPSGPSEHHR